MDKLKRPSWQEYFMGIALVTASRSTCPRANVGAVLVKNNQILVTGYNGAVSNQAHCDEVGCHIVHNHCMRAVHAEMNAICNCAKQGDNTQDADLYVTHFPCVRCMPLVIQSGIKRIYYLHDYNNDSFCDELVKNANIELIQVKSNFKGAFKDLIESEED